MDESCFGTGAFASSLIQQLRNYVIMGYAATTDGARNTNRALVIAATATPVI